MVRSVNFGKRYRKYFQLCEKAYNYAIDLNRSIESRYSEDSLIKNTRLSVVFKNHVITEKSVNVSRDSE